MFLVGILLFVFSIFLQLSWFCLMPCRSKHLLVFFLEAQRYLAFSSALQPFVQFVTIDKQMLALLDGGNASILGFVVEG